MKKSLKTLLSLALAVILCVSLCAGAFAEEDVPGDAPTAAANGVCITKDLQIARYTTVPTATFTFSFAPLTELCVGLQGNETIPAVSAVSVSYSAADGTDVTDGKVTKTAAVTFPEYPHAGVYAYKVTESDNFTAGTGETLVNDTTYYIVRVYVINGEDCPEIQYVTVERFAAATGTTVPNGEKVDVANFKFVNTYTKDASGGDDGASLVIGKKVSGDYADTSKKFSYSLTITAASTADAEEAFTYAVAGGDTQNGACGTAITFSLAHGEKVVVKGLTAGASYVLTETGAPNYTASAAVIVNGGTAVNESANEGSDLVLSGKGIGEKANTADFTNAYDDDGITPTGIIINNLPYVMLVAVAAAGLFIFVLSAKRREQEG